MRRNCGGFLDIFSDKKSVSSSQTTTEVNSRNRTVNTSTNLNNSNNLAIGLGTSGDPFGGPGDNVKIMAIIVAGALGVAALLTYFLRGKK